VLSKWEVESLVSIGLRNELEAVLLRIGRVSVAIRRVICSYINTIVSFS
jgi:hypothetical protein